MFGMISGVNRKRVVMNKTLTGYCPNNVWDCRHQRCQTQIGIGCHCDLYTLMCLSPRVLCLLVLCPSSVSVEGCPRQHQHQHSKSCDVTLSLFLSSDIVCPGQKLTHVVMLGVQVCCNAADVTRYYHYYYACFSLVS